MAEKKTQKAILGWKRKKWFSIFAPNALRGVFIGETPANDASYLAKRTITNSLMAITNDPKHQNYNITFEVDKINGLNVYTKVKKIEMIGASIKRMVKRGRDRIDDSYVAVTKNNVQVRLKTLLITKENTTGSILRKLSKTSRELFLRQIKTMTFEQIVQELVYGKFSRTVKQSLDKIYPLKSCEIKSLVVLKYNEPGQEIAEEPKKEEKQPEQTA